MRLFFALWPDDRLRSALAGLAQDAQRDCGGRATPSERIHLTLVFVGNVDRPRAAALERAAERVTGEPFELALDRVGYWRHNRIVWAGATHCPPALGALVQRLSAELAFESAGGEDRPYVPHLTLVRSAERKPSSPAVEPQPWHVREFVLVQSIAEGGGVRYRVLRRWPLAANVRK